MPHTSHKKRHINSSRTVSVQDVMNSMNKPYVENVDNIIRSIEAARILSKLKNKKSSFGRRRSTKRRMSKRRVSKRRMSKKKSS